MSKTLAALVLAITALIVASTAAQAKVFFSENFDDGEAAVESRWAASCGANWLQSGVFSLDTSQHVSGTASLKEGLCHFVWMTLVIKTGYARA